MKNSTILSVVLGLALLSSAGCAKSTDIGKMQEETIASVKIYLGELDILQRRHDALVATKGPSQEANALLESAGAAINAGRTKAASAPTVVAAAAKSGNPEALTQEHFNILAELQRNIEIAKDDLAGYETFMTNSAYASARPPTMPANDAHSSMDAPASGDPGSAAKMPAGTAAAGHTTDIPCSAEIALQCPEGQIDVCLKDPNAATHACVAK